MNPSMPPTLLGSFYCKKLFYPEIENQITKTRPGSSLFQKRRWHFALHFVSFSNAVGCLYVLYLGAEDWANLCLFSQITRNWQTQSSVLYEWEMLLCPTTCCPDSGVARDFDVSPHEGEEASNQRNEDFEFGFSGCSVDLQESHIWAYLGLTLKKH